MPLSSEQYKKIMAEYGQRRTVHYNEREQRRALVYRKIPAYRELDEQVPVLSMRELDERLSGRKKQPGDPSLQDRLLEVTEKKRRLLTENGFPADYLEMQYDCSDCKDTGYIDGIKCHCLREREVAVLYDQSHLRELFRENNFGLLSFDYYEGEALERFRGAVDICRHFIDTFDKDYENLYFYGTVGTGKSFLSICTAKELIERGHFILYFSATNLFETLSGYIFGSRDREGYEELRSDLTGCDLLIIDDLGTELTNAFTQSRFFELLNLRHLARKSTIISTNLDLRDLRDRYSDRIYSRIISDYIICKLEGPDIRMKKKARKKWNQ